MKKRSVIFLIAAAALALALLAGYMVYERTAASPGCPVISFESDMISVTTDATDEELLKGVTATDPEDGDVSDLLMVESVSNIVSGNVAKVSYVAFDSKNHMTRAQRMVKYTDYESPKFAMTHPMVFRASATNNLLTYITAEDMFDGDISRKVIYTIVSDTTTLANRGEYDVELRVVNSMGDLSKLKIPVEITDNEPNPADIQLKEYLVYIDKNSEFNPDDYFVSQSPNGTPSTDMSGIRVESDVDTSEAGVYSVTYSCGSGNSASHTRLLVVVE